MPFKYNPLSGNFDEVLDASSFGDVSGPGSSTDDAIVKWDGATGTLIQDSVAILSDAGILTGLTRADIGNIRVTANTISSINTDGDITFTPDGAGNVVMTPYTGMISSNGASGLAARTITGTAARISVSDGDGVSGDPTLDIDAAYVGQATITTLGTVTTGTWNGNAVTAQYGGTGLSTITDGAVMIGSGINAVTPVGPGTNGQLLIGSTGTDPAWASVTSSNNSLTVTGGAHTLNLEVGDISRFQGPYISNIGFTYSAGTFKVTGADGTALSSTNPGYITLHDKTNKGLWNLYTITADQSFIDDAGASTIIGNLFEWTTGVAITVDVPFFVYAVCNDSEDTITFMLSRALNTLISPTSANIGTPSSAIADGQNDFWAFSDITTTEYDANPCRAIGGIRMQMSAADDWTVQAFDETDGVGKFYENVPFFMPTGQMGADSTTVAIANGGTVPTWSNKAAKYTIQFKNRFVEYSLYYSGDAGADGAGAVNARFTIPYQAQAIIGGGFVVSGAAPYAFAGGNSKTGYVYLPNAANYCQIGRGDGSGSNNYLQWADFATGTRSVYFTSTWTATNYG